MLARSDRTSIKCGIPGTRTRSAVERRIHSSVSACRSAKEPATPMPHLAAAPRIATFLPLPELVRMLGV